jgi:hypothetical protein
MPRKPKHIQERVDQLITENHASKEIIEIIKNEKNDNISPSYISTRRKESKKLEEKNETPKTPYSSDLSKDSFRLLYNLMGMLGKKSLDETIETINDDYREIIKEKYRYDLDNEKTTAQVFREFEEAYRILESLDKNESQLKVYEKMELKMDPFSYYRMMSADEEIEFTENFFDFLSESTIKYWRDEKKVSISELRTRARA